MNERYIKAIEEGIAEYRKLSAQKMGLEIRMEKTLQLVAANVNMLADAEQERYIVQLTELTPPSGLSDAVLRVLKTNERLSATEVRDRLVESGYDFTGQANPLASIHTTLKRLVDAGDATANTPQPDGKTYYQKNKSDHATVSLSFSGFTIEPRTRTRKTLADQMVETMFHARTRKRK